ISFKQEHEDQSSPNSPYCEDEANSGKPSPSRISTSASLSFGIDRLIGDVNRSDRSRELFPSQPGASSSKYQNDNDKMMSGFHYNSISKDFSPVTHSFMEQGLNVASLRDYYSTMLRQSSTINNPQLADSSRHPTPSSKHSTGAGTALYNDKIQTDLLETGNGYAEILPLSHNSPGGKDELSPKSEKRKRDVYEGIPNPPPKLIDLNNKNLEPLSLSFLPPEFSGPRVDRYAGFLPGSTISEELRANCLGTASLETMMLYAGHHALLGSHIGMTSAPGTMLEAQQQRFTHLPHLSKSSGFPYNIFI
ncbi:hypothetical protein RRG08_014250, partial [Elysia crispata]